MESSDSTVTTNQNVPKFSDLAGLSVFITGGGSGIGASLTREFARQGAKVGFVSLTEETANSLCDEVEQETGRRPIYIQCDIRNVELLRAAINTVRDAHGPIQVLINNAARDTRHTLSSFNVEDWDNLLNTNLRSYFFAAQEVLGDMQKIGQGSIVNLGSNCASLGLSGYPAYVTSKAGIVGMSKALARELGPHNIRVNTLVPGWVMTDRQKELWVTDEALAECIKAQCLKSTVAEQDIANAAMFLASQASAMITGQSLVVDGGRV